MKQQYEGQGLERFFRIVFALAAVGVGALVVGFGWWIWSWIS
jgi:hypothetical protein